ncbi:hypothetical protein, partial [Streptomyces sp. NPDC059166]|uniref:hypothetical protein n=1 Tax=Streptomyces sp. NPDC059166 TaxID=3346752 RepID=UPI003675E34B
WNNSHNSSGTNRSTIPTMAHRIPSHPNEMTSNAAGQVVWRQPPAFYRLTKTHLNWAFITLMTRRLARKGPRTDSWTKRPLTG